MIALHIVVPKPGDRRQDRRDKPVELGSDRQGRKRHADGSPHLGGTRQCLRVYELLDSERTLR